MSGYSWIFCERPPKSSTCLSMWGLLFSPLCVGFPFLALAFATEIYDWVAALITAILPDLPYFLVSCVGLGAWATVFLAPTLCLAALRDRLETRDKRPSETSISSSG